jgi:hypothetical protein
MNCKGHVLDFYSGELVTVCPEVAAILAQVSRDFSHALHGNIDGYLD